MGGESTRPGAATVSLAEEVGRVVPVISALVAAFPDIPVSVDTFKAGCADAALEAGAVIVNDISAWAFDPPLLDVLVARKPGYVLMEIKKVVIPVAGWGTRSLPATKNIPKEMLPVYNKPIVQYVVEEAQASGLQDVVFVTNQNKTIIEDHFDYNLALEDLLTRTGKTEMLKMVRDVAEMANIISVRQKKQLGLGHGLCRGAHRDGGLRTFWPRNDVSFGAGRLASGGS